MIDDAVLGAAILMWIMVVFEGISWRREPGNRARRSLLVTFTALALAATFFSERAYERVGDLTGLPNLADLVARCSVLVAAAGAQVLLLHLTQEPDAARRMIKPRRQLMAVAIFSVVALFIIAPVHDGQSLRFTSDFGDSHWVAAYLATFCAYLGIALIDVFRGSVIYSPTAGVPLGLALRLIAAGCLSGMVYVLVKLAYLSSVFLGYEVDSAAESSVARMSAVIGGLLVLAGSVLPAAYPHLQKASAWLDNYRSHRRLYPLWSLLYRVAPEVALDPSGSKLTDRLRLRDLDFRLYRRVIEIRDGRLAIRAFLDLDMAQRARAAALHRGLPGPQMEAAVEAAVLVDGVLRARANRRPARGLPASQLEGGDLGTEIAWLLDVAGALSDAAAGVTTAQGRLRLTEQWLS